MPSCTVCSVELSGGIADDRADDVRRRCYHKHNESMGGNCSCVDVAVDRLRAAMRRVRLSFWPWTYAEVQLTQGVRFSTNSSRRTAGWAANVRESG